MTGVHHLTPKDRRGQGLDLGRRRFRWSLYVGGWTFVGLLFVAPTVARCLAEKKAIPWTEVLSELFNWYLWGLLFPLVWWLVRRYPVGRRKLLRRLPINLAFGLVISMVYAALILVKDEILRSSRPSFDLLLSLPQQVFSGIEYYLLIYFAIVAVIHGLAYYEKYRARELVASRLEAQLAMAHLDVLKTQLQPHFLFNTLNAISALMHRDVEAADRMITLLSDLLRLSLEKDHRHQVSLRSELDFLNRYLAIEKIRFRDRLAVETEVEPSCLSAQVPRLILQPLVENSIKHGIAMRSAAGHIAIRARRRGDRLELEVADDGPGLVDGPGGVREGVGLANTRARLEQIYGEDHRFELKNGTDGGLSVLLEVPFEEHARIRAQGATR